MTDIERQERELNRFWNELITTGIAPEAGRLPDEDAATLRHIHHMTRAPLPAAAQAQVDRAAFSWIASGPAVRLPDSHVPWPTDQPRITGRGYETLVPKGRLAPLDVAVVPAGSFRPARRASWRSLPYASVLLMVIALGVIFLMYATPRVSPLRPPISGNTPAETLLEITLPAEALPHGTRVSGALKDYSLDPGLDAAWEPVAGACCPGLRLTYVIGGSLSMNSAATAHVLRGGMSFSPEMVPAGGAVELGPGDAFVSRFDIAFFSKNPGDVPARFLDISFIDGFFPLDAVPSAWVWHPDVDEAYGLSLPDEPAIFRLDQVVLEPGATLLPAPGTYTQLGVTIADNEPIATCGKDAITNPNDKPVTVHVATLYPASPASLPALPEEPDPLCVGAVPDR